MIHNLLRLIKIVKLRKIGLDELEIEVYIKNTLTNDEKNKCDEKESNFWQASSEPRKVRRGGAASGESNL